MNKIVESLESMMAKLVVESKVYFTLPLPPSKNSGKRIVHNSKRTFILPSPRYMEWYRENRSCFKNQVKVWQDEGFKFPIEDYTYFDYIFLVARRNHADADNIFKGLHDLFQECQLVKNDRFILPRLQGIYKVRKHKEQAICFIQGGIETNVQQRKNKINKKICNVINQYL